MSGNSAQRKDLLIIAVFCVFFFFYGLWSFGLVGADEPRYAQVAREMLARHDWVTPTLNGVPWLEKPPLYYWGAMISYWLFGVRDWAARISSAALATLFVFFTYFFLRRFRRGAELASALMLASSVAIFGLARGASTDMPLAASFAIGLLAWFGWYATDEKRWLAAFYLFLALGALAKGPVAPGLAAIIIVVFALIRRDWRLILRTLWPAGILIFCAVALPWFVLVQLRNPQFFGEFILRQNFARFSTNLYRHEYPWWYYAPVLLLGLFPWTVFAISGFVNAIRSTRTNNSEASNAEHLPALRIFLVIWAAAPVIFFSLSHSKLPAYILPAVPAWILLAALYTTRAGELTKPLPRWIMALHALLVSVICGAVMCGIRLMLHPGEAIPRNVLLLAIAVFIGVFTFVLITLRIGGWEMLRFATLLPTILAVAFILKIAAPVIDATQSARPVAQQLVEMRVTAPIAVSGVHRSVEYGLGFYLDRQIESYDRGEVPAGRHLLVAPLEIVKNPPRGEFKRALAGEFGPQRLGYWWMLPVAK